MEGLLAIGKHTFIHTYIHTSFHGKQILYIYRKSASRFSRGTVFNMLKQSRINIMRGKKGRNYISRQACFMNRFTLQGFNERIFM